MQCRIKVESSEINNSQVNMVLNDVALTQHTLQEENYQGIPHYAIAPEGLSC